MTAPRSTIAALIIAATCTLRPGAAEPGAAQAPGLIDDPRSWSVQASGDEVMALAIDPRTPDALWAGTEGGGVIVWNRRTGAFAQHAFPSQPGLPDNRVHDIAFGRASGEAWLATEGGVSRASGSTWTAWSEADGLPDDDVRAVAVSPSGAVWAGTRASGIASWDPRTGRWTAWPTVPFDPAEPGPFDGPGSAAIVDIAVASDGRVWVAHGRQADSMRPALSLFDPQTGAWEHVGAVGRTGNPERGPSTDQILALAIDASGLLWAGTWARGVLQYDGERWRAFDADDGLCGKTVPALATDGMYVWATCAEERAGRGASRWDGSSWTAWPNAGDGALLLAIAAHGSAAYLGTNGPGAGGAGIVPIDGQGRVTARLTTTPSAPPSNDLTALRFASDGSLWAGTRGAGLLRFDGHGWSQYTVASTRGRLAGDTVTDLAERAGALWIASTKTQFRDGAWVDGGVSVVDLATLAWQPPLRSTGGGLPDDDVSSLAIDRDARVWIGFGAAAGGSGAAGTTHYGNGVVIHNPDTGSFEHHTYAGTQRGLAGDTVLDIALDEAGAWVATSHHNDPNLQRRAGGGVSRLTADAWVAWTGGRLGLATFHGSGKPSDRDPLITGDVRSIHVARDGTTWAGSYDLIDGSLLDAWPFVDAAINRFDGARWHADVIRGAGWITAIADDASGRVWIGTTRGHAFAEPDPFGVAVHDDAPGAIVREGDAWRPLVLGAAHIGAGGVTAIAEDPATGALWLATENGGLFVFGRATPPPIASATRPRGSATSEPTATPRARATDPATATRTAPAAPSPHRIFLPHVRSTAQVSAAPWRGRHARSSICRPAAV